MLLEGQGDALWHPGKKLIWGGYGHRTDRATYDVVSEMLGVPVVALRLVSDTFYHLDTCLSLVNETTAMVVTEAFDAEGVAMLRAAFPNLIEIPEAEALGCFAGNALALGGRYVVMHPGATETVARLRAHGLEPIEVDTAEYMKSGGSVFCMKMMIY
jgi:N-dimethylarginine dimethylaminohydrolase